MSVLQKSARRAPAALAVAALTTASVCGGSAFASPQGASAPTMHVRPQVSHPGHHPRPHPGVSGHAAHGPGRLLPVASSQPQVTRKPLVQYVGVPLAPARPQNVVTGWAGSSSVSYSQGGVANTLVSGPVVYAGSSGAAPGYYPEPCAPPQIIRIETRGAGQILYNRPGEAYVEPAPACGLPQVVRQVFYADPAPLPPRSLPSLKARY